MNPLQQIADNLSALNSDAPEVADAVIKLTNLAAHPSQGVVDEVIATLDQIGGLTRALRHGGPAPEDLQGLSDALTEATNMAHEAMHALQAAALPAVPEGYVLVRRDSIERAAQMAEVFDDGSDGADAETAARVAHDLRGWLIAATPKDQPAQGVDGA